MTIEHSIGDFSDKMPNGMTPADIPEGVELHQNELLDDQGKAIYKYGLEKMLSGSVRTFAEAPDAQAEYTDGQLLIFQPGLFYVYVTKRGLSAAEINQIGQLVADHDVNYSYSEYLADAVKRLDEVTKIAKPIQLSRMEPVYTVGEKTEATDELIGADLAEIGVIAARMKERLPALHSQILSIQGQLRALGVSLIHSDTGSQSGGRSFPIGKYKEESATK